jgi:hypothetical protein
MEDPTTYLQKSYKEDIVRHTTAVAALRDDLKECARSAELRKTYVSSGETEFLPMLDDRLARCGELEAHRQFLAKRGEMLLQKVTELGLGDQARQYVDTNLKELKAMDPKAAGTGVGSRLRQLFKRGGRKTRRAKVGGKRTRKH